MLFSHTMDYVNNTKAAYQSPRAMDEDQRPEPFSRL